MITQTCFVYLASIYKCKCTKITLDFRIGAQRNSPCVNPSLVSFCFSANNGWLFDGFHYLPLNILILMAGHHHILPVSTSLSAVCLLRGDTLTCILRGPQPSLDVTSGEGHCIDVHCLVHTMNGLNNCNSSQLQSRYNGNGFQFVFPKIRSYI